MRAKSPHCAAVLLILTAQCALAQAPKEPVIPNKSDKPAVVTLPVQSPVSNVQSADKTADMTITIEASRAQPTAGGTFSLSAVIKNIAAKPLVLTGKRTILNLPPEVAGSNIREECTQYGYFPTEAWDTQPAADKTVTIPPGDSYTVIWMATPPNTEPQGRRFFLWKIMSDVASEMEFVFFTPGDYKATTTIRYNFPDEPKDFLHSFTQSAIVHVSAPQSVILFGASLGGILGYMITILFLTEDRGNQKQKNKWLAVLLRFAAGAVGSVLLSTIVTILLARLSETQFLIRVSINDFWGAIAIGFVANIIGVKILDKILSGIELKKTEQPEQAVVSEERPAR